MLLYDKDNKREFKKRLFFSIVFAIVAFTIILSRLWYLQILQGKKFKSLSENNRIRIVKIPAPRGIIFDRKGKALVDNYPSFDLSIIPEDVNDLESTIKKLSDLLNVTADLFKAKLKESRGNPPFKPIKVKTNLDYREVAILETNKLDLPGVTIEIAPKRLYIFDKLAAHLIGYTGKISESQLKTRVSDGYSMVDLIGKYGIEHDYETVLRGSNGGAQVEVDAVGRKVRVLRELEPTPGENIFLTIELDIQKLAEKALADMIGTVIVMDPNTGDILALASSPSFNPNMFSLGISSKEWECLVSNPNNPLANKAIQGQYPPGSVYKIITAIAGLEEKVITPETVFYCDGSYRFGRRAYRCWQRKGHGRVNLHRALVESCDVYFYQVGQRLGVDRIAYYSSLFGLGKPTGISRTNEKHGLIPTSLWKLEALKSPWQESETLSMAIGQGFVLVTPLQILNLISSMANGGILYRPQIVKKITSPGGDIIKEFFPEKMKKIPVSDNSINLIKDALWGVVNERLGTGWRARIEGADVAGKTGTAQVVGLPKDSSNEYVPFEHRDHAWFSAFAPKDKSKVAIVVLLEHGGHGGNKAAQIARDILKGSLKILNDDNSSF
ncbi:MAG: penicillin-binding protein 2 [Deltaproteobacteria bacterium CG12_big_fil_rev_8_21_14_0_65_43_10]|nr:MAG: penicillin-binding protein 2 [Deltaproteobacteria bacterium CG12_big_fil_rev_8_21_14_0_65_43_10]